MAENAHSHGKGRCAEESTLASQATFSLINNGGRLDATLKELGSSDNLRQLATSLVTAGVLSGLGNAISIDGKSLNSVTANDGFAANVGKNLVTGLTRATVTSAVTGTDLETSIRTEVIASILNAASAQGADWIGTQAQNNNLNAFSHAFAHAVAGCAAGAAGASAPGSGISGGSGGSGCGAGALGAAVGELSAQLYGVADPAKTIAFASMMSGIAAAATGQGAQGIAIASGAGANAAENNRLLHINERTLIAQLAKNQAKQDCHGDAQCESVLTLKWTDTLEHAAAGLVDDQADAQNLHYLQTVLQTAAIPGSAGAMGGAASYLTDMQTAQTLLSPYIGKTITVNGVTATSDGAPQTYFSATPAQRADPYANDFLGQAAGAIIPGMAQRDANRIASLSVQNGAAQPVYPVEEVVLGGMVADRVVSAATRWIGSLDVALAGKVGASNGGNLSAQQITRAGIPARLSAAEQGTLATIDTLPDTALQGAAREYVANSYFTRNGFTPLEGKCGSGNCFDGVYIKGDKVYVNEVKPLNANGSIKLSGASGAMDTQMTKEWIVSAIKRLDEGTLEQRATATLIEKAIANKTLVKVVTGVNSNGMTIVRLE